MHNKGIGVLPTLIIIIQMQWFIFLQQPFHELLPTFL